ncbi:hypothetical protein HJG53_12255 [Sphingomonas sp. ID1715]|uniref:hypothetical protein n=1 Tax=Sphingomonas sp. ID1715 TaxID=1656898 RepID=UPI0014897A6D|nr:hypothetical protein [Sphingomonas sp. ID1715]NNM77681.1 hypothetical protein [Sphingomonas sp. ID1715]
MSARLARLRSVAADACFVALTLAAWTGQTVLTALGIVPAGFLLATGGDGEVLFSQLENLSHHYLSAAADARAAFDSGAVGIFAGLLTLLALVRLPALVARLRAELVQGHDHE